MSKAQWCEKAWKAWRQNALPTHINKAVESSVKLDSK